MIGLVSCRSNRKFELHNDRINFANYFELSKPESDASAPGTQILIPVIKKDPVDSLSDFIISHSLRFDYILINGVDSLFSKLLKISKSSSDPFSANKQLVEILNADTNFKSYFLVLSNYHSSNPDKQTFTIDEIMKVASRFFFCHGVKKKDSTIQSHVCVGINGQKMLNSEKDYTVLAAFCIEAIFKDGNEIISDFFQTVHLLEKKGKSHFTNFSFYVNEIQQLAFQQMERNEDLKAMLLNYYKTNADNLGFIIRSQ